MFVYATTSNVKVIARPNKCYGQGRYLINSHNRFPKRQPTCDQYIHFHVPMLINTALRAKGTHVICYLSSLSQQNVYIFTILVKIFTLGQDCQCWYQIFFTEYRPNLQISLIV